MPRVGEKNKVKNKQTIEGTEWRQSTEGKNMKLVETGPMDEWWWERKGLNSPMRSTTPSYYIHEMKLHSLKWNNTDRMNMIHTKQTLTKIKQLFPGVSPPWLPARISCASAELAQELGSALLCAGSLLRCLLLSLTSIAACDLAMFTPIKMELKAKFANRNKNEYCILKKGKTHQKNCHCKHASTNKL